MPDPLNRKPWPMKWVALVILVMIVPYTILTIKYRKPSPAYQPYEDSKQRANVMRLLDAGYQRITVTAERPADPLERVRQMNTLAAPASMAGGLPEGLATTLVEIPQLPVSFSSVLAPRESASLLPYPVLFTCVLADQKHQLGGAQVYVRGLSVVIVPVFEPLDGELTARSKESPVLIQIPGGSLQTGEHTVSLVGSGSSQKWTLTVR
jgi:hypothetical protein